MRFPPAFLDDIRARVTISSVVGRKVAWDRRKSNPGRGDFWACCPFHGEKTASFHVEDKKGRYYCFGCKVTGDIFTFLVEKEGMAFPEAVERLAAEAGLPVPKISEEESAREEKRIGLYEVMEKAAAFFEVELQSARGAKARGYLADRGLSTAIQREFRLGYAPEGRFELRNHLAAAGASLEAMVELNLLAAGDDIPAPYDRFRDRVMFPIRDPRGRVIAFGGRALSSDALAKYINSSETPLFHKGAVLYNFDKARTPAHKLGQIIAVEGYVDVIAMHRAGLEHAVAPMGTALTEDQLRLLWRAAPEPTLCFDGDSAGLKAAHRAIDVALPLLAPGHSLRFAFLPDGQDPDDLLKTAGPEALKTVVGQAEPLSDALWRRALGSNDRSTPERKAEFERNLRALIATIGDAAVRAHYEDDIRSRLDALWGRTGGSLRRRPQQPRGHWKPGRVTARPWDFQGPASSALKAAAQAASPAKGTERRERSIVATFVNHPSLVDDLLEEFSILEFQSRELDSLRRALLDAAALGVRLETPALRHHLTSQGFGPLLDRLDTQAAHLNEWYSHSGAASEDARTALTQMIALHRKHVTLTRELQAAEAAFAADASEEALAHLTAIREALSAHAGSEASIDGFGAASGRPQASAS